MKRAHPTVAVILKGYPRLSETFIAQEILGLERQGIPLYLVSLRQPTDTKIHPVHREIAASVNYLPEYLYQEPCRVFDAWRTMRSQPGYPHAFSAWRKDLTRDRTANRIRRFGQALVLAAELPDSVNHLHAHFAHTPSSVTRYAALLTGRSWSFSAHAKDVWTSPAWELEEKMTECAWAVTCTTRNLEYLQSLSPSDDKVRCVYHGLDLERFTDPGLSRHRPQAGSAGEPAHILSVGRAVDKKGFDVLLKALAMLPPECHWTFSHVGAGEKLTELKAQAKQLRIDDRVQWHGPMDQGELFDLYRSADLFVLASRVTASGDRDGLPNVLMEAMSQRVACVSTAVSGIPELIDSGNNGLLVAPDHPEELSQAIGVLLTDPDRRVTLANQGYERVHNSFDYQSGVAAIAETLRHAL